MKYTLILILFLITGSKGIAQSSQMNDYRVQAWSAKKNDNLVLYWKSGSDTIEIIEPLQVHYIKVGNNVYQLIEHATTIEPARNPLLIGGATLFPQGGTLYNYNLNSNLLPITQ